jgi:hypothetical protein
LERGPYQRLVVGRLNSGGRSLRTRDKSRPLSAARYRPAGFKTRIHEVNGIIKAANCGDFSAPMMMRHPDDITNYMRPSDNAGGSHLARKSQQRTDIY